jgi:hypothetical protein
LRQIDELRRLEEELLEEETQRDVSKKKLQEELARAEQEQLVRIQSHTHTHTSTSL